MLKRTVISVLASGGILLLSQAFGAREVPQPSGENPVLSIYVSPEGDDTREGTAAAPWRSLQKAFDAAVPGTVIYLSGGTYRQGYNLSLSSSGERGRPITVKALDKDNPPVLDGEFGRGVMDNPELARNLRSMSYFLANYRKLPPFDPEEGLISISGSWVVFDGLKLTGSRSCGMYFMQGASHIVVQNCHVEHCQGPGICFGAENSASTDVKVLHNYVYNCSQRAREAVSLRTVDSFEVAYNKVEMVIKESIDAKGGCSNGSIHHNHVLNGGHCAIYMDAGFPDRPVEENIDIYCNLVENPWGTGICVAAESGNSIRNIRIYNNVAFNRREENKGSGIKVAHNGSSTEGVISDVFIYNNTVYGFKQQGIYVNYPNVRNIRICNNISAKTLNNLAIREQNVQDPSQVVMDRNLLWGAATHPGRGSVQADPLFRYAENGDFRLLEGSPAINVAYKKYTPGDDYSGTPRPQGRGADLGAFEFIREK